MTLGLFLWKFYGIILMYSVGSLYSIKQLFWKSNKKIKRPKFLDEKSQPLALITGGTKGIGLELAKLLAKNDFSLILAARNKIDGEKAVSELKNINQNSNIKFYPVDLSELDQIRKFVDQLKKENKKLNLLVNNAGLMMTPYKLVQNGKFEWQWATNVVATVFLTESLLPLVEKGAEEDGLGRIINLSSSSMFAHDLTVDYLKSTPTEEEYSSHFAYSNTKLAIALYTADFQNYLNERKKGAAGVSTYCLHPGVISTGLYQHLGLFWRGFFTFPLVKLFLRSPQDSAWDLLYLCFEDAEKLVPGKYYENNVVACVPKLDPMLRQAFRDYVAALKKTF